jgi:hypothetical protein
MRYLPTFSAFVPALALASTLGAQNPPVTPPPANPPAAQQPGGPPQGGANARRPRPYAQVITARAHTMRGGITVHQVDERYFFEIPDSLLHRDILLVSRESGVPAGANQAGLEFAGMETARRVVRWNRVNDRVQLEIISYAAVADDTLPIALSVRNNNFSAILGSFPIAAFTPDSNSYVIDVTDFFAGDTPALSALTEARRRQWGVRRLDPARSYVSSVKSFPINVEVRHVQTYDATTPPGDRTAGTVSVEMRQSMILLPKTPMRPRIFDQRVGFFTVRRINYGLDVLKAAEETFITRWRLEPKDPDAYARGEIVEPVKPITFYIDPATPARWRRFVKEGVEQWKPVFEKAGFKNAIVAKDPPTKAEDPNWDMDDARYSVVRWTASLVRNAEGPSTPDPRSGEIINAEITWFHNHLRSYRNWMMVETGASNPLARTLDMTDELMGETMRQVIAHEVGHALGLQHNMVASSSFPVDSLRSPTFTSKYGVSATIMDYARQNYVAQPNDGLKTKDFIRRVGPFDDFAINWGYRLLPATPSPQAERATLNDWFVHQTGPFKYHYVPQSVNYDPRSQTEDLGDDPVKASTYAIMNYKRMIPQLVSWTSKPGNDYDDLEEVYGDGLQRWYGYMNHVATEIGGMHVDLKTADQGGNVFTIVPKAKQKGALAFLNANIITEPTWLEPKEITSRIGPSNLDTRQSAMITSLLNPARLNRLAESETIDPANAYPLAEYLADLKADVFNGTSPDANRRMLQRVYVERLGVIVNPPPPPTAAAGAGRGGGPGGGTPFPYATVANVPRTDLPALARLQLKQIRDDARRGATTAAGSVAKAHWDDIASRVDDILEAKRK